MADMILHPSTRAAVDAYLASPSQATVIIGPKGIGKGRLLRDIVAQLLHTKPDIALEHPQALVVGNDEKAGIDDVRKVQHFLALKPADAVHARRVVCIEDAERLATEAQNALLKSIEETPAECFILLTTTSPNRLLPTIMSRVQRLVVSPPAKAELQQYFIQHDYIAADVSRAAAMSGGLPGTMTELLEDNQQHPVLQAADTARQLLQASKFERLILIDKLAKDRDTSIAACSMLCKMALISLAKDGLVEAQQQRWRAVLSAGTEAEDMLRKNAQAKLTLTALALKF